MFGATSNALTPAIEPPRKQYSDCTFLKYMSLQYLSETLVLGEVGSGVGDSDGDADGTLDGEAVGKKLGENDGFSVGELVGSVVGSTSVGDAVGEVVPHSGQSIQVSTRLQTVETGKRLNITGQLPTQPSLNMSISPTSGDAVGRTVGFEVFADGALDGT